MFFQKNTLILILLALSGSSFLTAQTSLPNSKRKSSELYVYKANIENLRQIYLKGINPDGNMLQTFVTSYARNEKEPSQQRGNYLIVGADENNLVFTDYTVDDFNFKIIPDEQMKLCLYDSLGNIIRDAEVKCGSSKLKFDQTTNTYNANKVKDGQIIEVNNKGVLHYIEIEKKESSRYYSNSNLFKKSWRIIKWKWLSLKEDISGLFNPDDRPVKNKYTGFIVFSKPKYKPGETVKLKAYMTDNNGKLYNKPVDVRLYSNYYSDKTDTTLIKNLSPYRPGMYQCEFKLTDSLNLKLDNRYTIALKTKNKKDNELSSAFKYEEYELKSAKFSVETQKTEYAAGDSVKIKFKATDENDMALYGGKVEIMVTPARYGNPNLNKQQSAFIPDVLWTETVDMSEVSEKEITIPDSIFPAGVSLNYEVKCTFLSADNEKVEQSKTLFRNANDYLIDFSMEKGILTINELNKGEHQQTQATINISGENRKTISENAVTLPYKLTVPWFASNITVTTNNSKGYFSLEDVKDEQLGYQFYRRNDSVFLKVENPANIPFWYTVRKKNNGIAKGYATSQLTYSAKDNGKEGYSMQLSYLFGKERNIEEKLPFVRKNMSIDVSTPTTVYPGQKANVTVSVTNKKGKPVENADITAYSFTSKFNDYSMPYIAIKGKARYAKQFKNTRYNPDESGINNQKSSLTWERWKQYMSLDTIEYYKFLYPDIFYSYEEPSADGTTQIAPYVVINGALQGVHLLWIDDRLYYAKQAQQLDTYLFRVTPGKHNLKFRTYDREVSVYNVMIKEGTKTILSFDAGIPYIRKNIYGDLTTPFALVSKPVRKEERGMLSKNEMDYLATQLITVNNNFGIMEFPGVKKYLELPVYINTGNNNYYLDPKQRTSYENILRANVNAPVLAGPFPYRNTMNGLSDMATLYADMKPLTNFQIEGGYNYTLYENFQKMKNWERSPVEKWANAFVPETDFKTKLLTERNINEYFNTKITSNLKSLSGRVDAGLTADNDKNKACRLSLLLNFENNRDELKPAFIFIVPQNKEDITEYSLYYGETREFSVLPEGNMNIHIIFGDTTSCSTNITLYKNGQNYLRLDSISRDDDNKPAVTAFNLFRRNTTKRFAANPYVDIQKNAVVEVVPVKPTGIIKKSNLQKGVITGAVKDSSGEALIGATVRIKGTSTGTVTDFDGHFELKGASEGNKIEIAYLGYITAVVNYQEGYDYNIALKESVSRLNEVVVIGYGVQKKSLMTGAVITKNEDKSALQSLDAQVLQGRVAGLMIRGVGASSTNELDNPLIIVNGLPYNGYLEDIDPSSIVSVNILKDQTATSVYGAKAANGVIMIQTSALKKGNENQGENDPEQGNSMRRNFHDDAFWQPALKTDKKGEASFEVTYPDDITSWNACFIAIGNKKQTDKKQLSIQSFKALTARLSTPRFAIRGDSLNAIGRIANHLNDSIEVNQTITVGGVTQEKKIGMTTSHVEQIPVTISGEDSITIAYSLNQPNGYFDGEERSFPVFEKGMLQTFGEFKVINDTTTTTFNVNPDLGAVTLHAEASSLDVFLKEIDKIDRYPYFCNEQMASKIKVLLSKKSINGVLGKEFKDDNKIRDLINRLKNNSNAEGLWGWWNKNKTEFWISKQIIGAMLDAEKAGFKTGTDTLKLRAVVEQQLKDGLAKLPMMAPYEGAFAKQELLDRLLLLKKLNAPVDYPAYYAQIDYQLKSLTINDKLKEMLLFSALGLNEKINMDTLMYYARKTMLGSMFWGDEKGNKYYSPCYNNVENTLMAYGILKNLGGHEQDLEKVRNYFFERRHDGSWQNTYESSRIIETILPDMLSPKTSYSEVSMNVNDKKVSTFPYTEKIDANQPVRIKKESTLPLFVTAYQQEWNRNPQPESSKGFAVQTVFKENHDTVSILKAGKPVNLEVTVKVDADAEYVQIEVPIPAGCSYESKSAGFYGKEANREYFKEKVSIFCNQLTKGEHKFTVELISRFTGRYTLNPAKAELMYFPTFYGNDEVKSMEIY